MGFNRKQSGLPTKILLSNNFRFFDTTGPLRIVQCYVQRLVANQHSFRFSSEKIINLREYLKASSSGRMTKLKRNNHNENCHCSRWLVLEHFEN